MSFACSRCRNEHSNEKACPDTRHYQAISQAPRLPLMKITYSKDVMVDTPIELGDPARATITLSYDE